MHLLLRLYSLLNVLAVVVPGYYLDFFDYILFFVYLPIEHYSYAVNFDFLSIYYVNINL